MSPADTPVKRNSRAHEAVVITDPDELARTEARNGLRQYDIGILAAQEAIERGGFKLRPSLILSLHREALAGISAFAGNYRPAAVEIQGSRHTPPPAGLVPELVEDMCEYVNAPGDEKTPLHLSAYVMWRLNWIHPFADGNGRTSRVTSYVVLCVRGGNVYAGSPTIPDQIVSNRQPYFDALDAADAAWQEGRIDVSKMTELIEALFARQLTAAFKQVGGKTL